MKEIKNLRRWTEEFFKPIDWDTFFVRGANGNTCYGFEAIFRLSIILGLLGCKTFRSKENFLKTVEKQGKLNDFYRLFGIRWKAPDLCLRYGLNRPSASEFCYMNDFINLDSFEKFRNQTLISPDFIGECRKRKFSIISIDGKYVRNSVHRNSSSQHVKSMNFVCEKQLIHSVFAEAENHWIKTELSGIIDSLRETLPGHLTFTGDAIYNTPTIREKIFSIPKADFVFSLKKTSALKSVAE